MGIRWVLHMGRMWNHIWEECGITYGNKVELHVGIRWVLHMGIRWNYIWE